jgi:hypothetical protein
MGAPEVPPGVRTTLTSCSRSRTSLAIRGLFKLEKKELNLKEIYKEADHVEFKVVGLAYRYDDASFDGLRSLSSRLCKCCHVLCAVKRGDSRRTS